MAFPAGDLTGWDACFKSRSGEMFFGGFSGGVAFRPDSILDRSYAPPVVLTDIQIEGKPVAPGVHSALSTSITYADQIALTHEQNVFALTFVALSYLNPAANRYRYRLDGLDRKWVEVGSDRRTATYTTLPPGSYTFRAQVETRPGVWSEPGVVLGVAILPPWWATSWFRTLAALMFAVSLWALYVFRLRRASATIRARMEERIVERERIARELHDTLLQGVQGLILRFQAAAERIPPTEPTREMLETALDRADEMMTQARDRVTNLRVALDTVRSLPDELGDALGDLARRAGADLAIVVEGERRAFNPLVREEAYWIGHEAIVNAAKHARATRIEVEIGYGPREWWLRVRDDGCGIDVDVLERGGKPNHWGMRGMRERASRIGARLETWSRPGAGTEIELRVDGAVAYERGTTPRGKARSAGRSPMTPIRVLVVDDHPILREGIAAVIANQADIVVAAEAGDGADAVAQFRRHRPDVTLMDLQMPQMNGLEALITICREFPDARIVVLTTYQGDVQAARALEAGAAAYLLKTALRKDLIETIRDVHAGRRRITADVAVAIAEHHAADSLSAREREVLQLVAAGNANKRVAERLSISEETVKGHVRSILAKLNASDRTQAVTIGLKRGIIALEEID